MKTFTIKVIHIINHHPPYEEYVDKPRPQWNWVTPDGQWVGIWGYDWSDQLANEVIKLSDEFEHEVWQPDFRAEKIYSHTFSNKLIHRLFPASSIGVNNYISPQMLTFIKSHENLNQYIFHLSYPHFSGINKTVIDTYKNSKFILTFHGEINLPFNAIFRFQKNPVKKFFYFNQHLTAKRYFKLIDHVTYPSERNIKTLRNYFKGKLTLLTMGIDTNEFRNITNTGVKEKLQIPIGKKILLTVSRLQNLKQIDKLIDVLTEIPEDFLFLVVGHGKKEYESYLKGKAKSLLERNKVRFEGYRHGNELIEYYNIADLFIHVSKSEAGPVSVMEAMSCGLPVFTTDTGNTSELLKTHDAGAVVGIASYTEWKEKLIQFLKGHHIKPLDIRIVRHHYDWKNVAGRFLEIYKNTSEN